MPSIPRRTLFGFSRKKPATKSQTPNEHPGFETLVVLNSQLRQKVRPTPPHEVAGAFKAFLRAHDRPHKISPPLAKEQVREIAGAFEYLRSTADDVEGIGLSNGDIRLALRVLSAQPDDGRYEAHLQLADQLYEELVTRRSMGEGEGFRGNDIGFESSVALFIKILSRSGQAKKAREILRQYWQSGLKQNGPEPWSNVLRGFANEGKKEEVSATVASLPTYGVPFDSAIHAAIVIEYAQKDDIESTKTWYDHPIADARLPQPLTNHRVSELCIRKGEYDWGEKIFRSNLETKQPTREAWASILKWSAAKGKGVDEIERMMNVMIRRNEEGSGIPPDTDMINELIELAISKEDPYTAERYVALGQKLNLQPDARTFLLQIDYRMKVGDLDGARAAYSNLQNEDNTENQDPRLINKLIVVLCERDQPYEKIMPIVEDVSERRIRFYPRTIAALVRLHLNRAETHQANELLSTHTLHYQPEERDSIRETFVSYILTRGNRTALAWHAYLTLRDYFPDTPVTTRTKLMTEFFARRSSDLGIHVFGHMRQSPNRSQRPKSATYKACFEGIARAGGDMKSLQIVHNMLKLDTEIEPDTRLYNALMLAYTACGNSSRALEFWNDIVHSREGPTYNSIQIALQACEVASFGDESARDIWLRLTRFGIKVTKEIYAAYVGALAGQGHLKECVQLVEKVEAEIGEKPDALLIGTLYNAAQSDHNKRQIEQWASSTYPQVWAELLEIGKTPIQAEAVSADAEDEAEDDEEEATSQTALDATVSRQGSTFNIDRSVEA
ncbi:MAG: hypothetical protein Q9191_001599 [Dirinaria sp. TL-2023a]